MMARAFLFYNPLAGQGRILEDLDAMQFVLDDEVVLCDMTKPETYEQALFSMEQSDYLVLCGGDGTLNRFVNLMEDVPRPNEIYYYPAGQHNDFALDHGRWYGCNPFPVTRQLGRLPRVRIGSREGSFLTGILFASDSRILRTLRHIPGYSKNSRPQTLRLKADGGLYHYDKVRFAAIMQGKHCFGGLIPDPNRQPGDEDLSCVLLHGCSLWKGKHLLHRLQKNRAVHSPHLTVHRGRRIKMTFDAPACILTDGELQTDVMELTAIGKETI